MLLNNSYFSRSFSRRILFSEETNYLKIGRASDLKNPKERFIYRLFEIFPGFLSWGSLFLFIFLSWKKPFWVAIFAISFVFYWFLRTIYFAFHLRSGYKKMKEHEKIDWLEKLKKEYSKKWQEIYHLILLPTYKESLEIIRQSLKNILETDFPKNKIIVVLSFEERAGKEAEERSQQIEKEFGDKFFRFLITWHPANLPGEIPGHGSNDAWAARKAKELIIDPLKIPYQNIIVSSFDIDTCVFPKYFSCLTYHYLKAENSIQSSFQPIPLYINNIYEAPAISRIFAFSSTFWHTMNQERPEKLITFSSHSMSFKALVDVDFKQTNVISDDSRIFWQCFFKYNGDYKVVPLYYPVSMDANCAKSFWRTLLNIYKQQRRWAYGVGEIPYFLYGFLKNKKIPLKKKISLGYELIEGHWSWATAPILIFVLGWLPLILGGEQFSSTLIAYNLPKITSRILTISMIGLIFSAYFSLLLLPPRPPEYGRFKFLIFALSWILVPITMIFFTSFPALDAQTRWMLGKYMGFWATEKIRKPKIS